ncbi:neutral zinc metallopeptidase [Sphaerisporangium rufum]|nr:neutral zinc metallopeptidase [Sphaerisporangium rufum]
MANGQGPYPPPGGGEPYPPGQGAEWGGGPGPHDERHEPHDPATQYPPTGPYPAGGPPAGRHSTAGQAAGQYPPPGPQGGRYLAPGPRHGRPAAAGPDGGQYPPPGPGEGRYPSPGPQHSQHPPPGSPQGGHPSPGGQSGQYPFPGPQDSRYGTPGGAQPGQYPTPGPEEGRYGQYPSSGSPHGQYPPPGPPHPAPGPQDGRYPAPEPGRPAYPPPGDPHAGPYQEPPGRQWNPPAQAAAAGTAAPPGPGAPAGYGAGYGAPAGHPGPVPHPGQLPPPPGPGLPPGAPYGPPGGQGPGAPQPPPAGHGPAAPQMPPGAQGPAPRGWNAQPGGPPYPPPGHLAPGWTPPRRKSTAGAVIGAVVGVIAATFVVMVVGAALLDKAGGTDTTSPVAVPTYAPPTYDPYTPRPDPSTTTLPTGEASPAASTAAEPDGTSSSETTRSRPTLNTSLKGNTVYRVGTLPQLACRGGSVNVYSDAQLKALILRTGKCMSRTWAPALRRVGIDFSPPGYAITARGGRGACGDFPQRGSIVPYYCPRNYTIYAATSALSRGRGNSPGYASLVSWHGAFTGMMAHEYGHHVQQLSGLANSWWSRTLDSRTSSGRLALSRRYELQANCFSGMWMRSVAGSYPIPAARRQSLYYFFGNVGDWPGRPRDHGSPANSGRWFRQGYERNKAYQCNTWLAPSSTTS